MTGADNNREIKVWSCESWICLQTIHILPAPDLLGGFQVEPCLKAQMDLAANFLILSDIQRKVSVYYSSLIMSIFCKMF